MDEQYEYFAQVRSQGQATGYDYDSQGYAVGALKALKRGHVLGLAVASSHGENTPKRSTQDECLSKIKQDSMMLALYGKMKLKQSYLSAGLWSLDVLLAYGEMDNDYQRYVKTSQTPTCTRWSNAVYNIAAQVNYLWSTTDQTN